MINWATQRASEIGHIGACADTLFWKSYLEIWRGDALATLEAAEALETVAREYGVAQYLNEAELHLGWARGRINDPVAGSVQLRRVLSAFVDQGVRVNLGFYSGLLAGLEAKTLGSERALARIDEAFRLSNEVEHRCSLPFLHRLRGEILQKGDPADPVPVEEAFRTSIGIAKEQGARSPVLLASLLLAKFYQSTGRPAEAHAVLEPALEGFSPTPEMPEIAEAQALLAALENSDEVKNAAASRQRRLQLQTSYGKALMLSRGYGSEEAKAAFAHAQELATGVDNAAQRFDAYFGQWVGSMLRGELRSARETAEAFLSEAEKEERTTEAVAAHYSLGTACFYQGGLAEARAHLELALRIFDPESDREATRFGTDTGVAATGYLGFTSRLLGEVGLARNLIEAANVRAVESAHAPTLAMAYVHTALFDMLRDDAEAGRRAAESSLDVSRAHGLGLFLSFGALYSTWARAWLGDRESGMKGFREALAAYLGQGNKLTVPLFQGLIAELEAEGDDAHGALRRIDEALALANETGERWTDSLLHRIRGAILLKRDPANPAPAEEAFLAAIAVAKQQGARNFGLRAALSLAKLYQSTGRSAEAHAVLAPALEGFSPTPEMPEIADAEALMERLA